VTRSVCISGAGIAGPALAFWLKRYGFEPALVERAPQLRGGGYVLDFWGVGFEVADRMGLVPELRERGYSIDRMRYVRSDGRTRSTIDASSLSRSLGDRFMSLARGDLATSIYAKVEADVETRFGDFIREFHDDGEGVDVTFEHGGKRRFDLLVGCDGVHSSVRRQLYGASDADSLAYLGYVAASFITTGYPERDSDSYVSWAAPGRQISRYALRGDRTAFLLVCVRDEAPRLHDRAAQIELLDKTFADDDWRELPEIRKRLAACDELYFDEVTQVHTPAWSRGRVALVGDAAFCPSLLAGAGSSYALAGAYLLAGELAQARGDHRVAFAAYEHQFRPFIEKKQKAARRFASTFAPRSRFGLFVRDQAFHLTAIPGLGDWLIRRTVADDFELPDYPT
jgi:2-polyprenyl-6-methoxyphenol hydroxylase-like FAD-dependent oxidoreductase